MPPHGSLLIDNRTSKMSGDLVNHSLTNDGKVAECSS